MCLNVRGREPQGIVAPEEYDALCDELLSRLEQLPGPDVSPIGKRVFRPSELWRDHPGIPPYLIVFFGDLGWRSAGSLGDGRHWTFDNDTGPDDANHDRHGICVVVGPDVPPQPRDDLEIYDIAATILVSSDVTPPEQMRGRVLRDFGQPASFAGG